MSTAVRTVGLGKRYRLGQTHRARPSTFRTALSRRLRRLARDLIGVSVGRDHRSADQEFWALRDVSLQIADGERIGIIGRNGSGKSTLLKLLSRITEPTTGEIHLFGRVACLLEVGAGFHPELTGRENVFLNGAILGMRAAEIRAKFDDIVAFAEIEKFLDTPVKRYSSGMYVRLAFSVAAHLDSDIVIVDEVLAVGDFAFQRKCLDKMEDVARAGRTVILVSHNMTSIRDLCQRAIWLEDGRLVDDGPAEELARRYLASLREASQVPLHLRADRRGNGRVRLTGVRLTGANGDPRLETGAPWNVRFEISGTCDGLTCSFTVYDPFGQPVTFFDSAMAAPEDRVDRTAQGFGCHVDALPLLPGRYRINAALARNGELLDHVEAATWFEVKPPPPGRRPQLEQGHYGSVQFPHYWIRPDD